MQSHQTQVLTQNNTSILSQCMYKCIMNIKAEYSCFNNSCTKYPFVCPNQQCQCREDHQNCMFLILKNLKKKVISRIVPVNSILDKIDEKIQKSIDQLSSLRQLVVKFVSQNAYLYGLSKQEISFLKAQQLQNGCKLTGKSIQSVCEILKSPNKNESLINQKIKTVWDKFDKQQNMMSSTILSILKNYQNSESIESIIKEYNNPIPSIFKNSKVVKTKDDLMNLYNFFQNTKIKRTNLLYRASQNQFLVQKFYEKVSNIPFTVIVVQNQFGKILGGYTPLPWYKAQNAQIQYDKTLTSFVFSLTKNTKFSQVQKNTGIIRTNRDGPIFGCIDRNMYICDKANKSKNSLFYINAKNFYNQKYKKNDKQTIFNLIGDNKNCYEFLVKEWQVWQLEFQKPVKSG